MVQHVGRRRMAGGHFRLAQFRRAVAGVTALLLFVFVSVAAAESSLSMGSRREIRVEKRDEVFQSSGKGIFVPHREESPRSGLGSPAQGPDQGQASPDLQLGVRTVSAAILGALAAALSSAAGLGGGPLFITLLTLLVRFEAKTAVVVSNFMILGGASVGAVLNVLRDHPHQLNRPLVDLDIALLLEPNMLLGISVGVIVNGTLPNWLISAILTAVLLGVTIQTAGSGVRRWRVETQQVHEKRRSSAKRSSLRRATTATERDLTESLLGFYQSMSGRYPVKTILGLVLVWLAVFGLQLFRDGHGNKDVLALEACGIVYWVLTAAQIPLTGGVTAWVIYRQRETAASNDQGTPESQEQGHVLAPQESFYLSGVAFLAGLMGGMLGVGGAIIISPLLLSVGVLPQVTAATSQFMVFFSSSMSVAQYWLLGRVPLDYALVAALICVVFSVVGILGLQRMVSKYGRPSLIVFCITFVLGLSVVLMMTLGSLDVWNEYKSGAYMGFSYPC